MAKADNPFNLTEIEMLLSRSRTIQSKYKKKIEREKRKCKGCGKSELYSSGFCEECFLGDREARENVKIGKTWRSTDGYWRIYDPDGKIQLLHRYTVGQYLGRKLRKDEIVRHRDGNKDNNDISNLSIEGLSLADIVCPHCGEPVFKDPPQPSLPPPAFHLPKLPLL